MHRFKQEPIAVLLGGRGLERDISLLTGQNILAALKRSGYNAISVDPASQLDLLFKAPRFAAAFVALHGPYGEDGCIQGVLEWLNIPYTGSGVRASALAMDKSRSKTLFKEVGLSVIPGTAVSSLSDTNITKFPLPVFIKPNALGSSVASGIARTETERTELLTEALGCDSIAILEEYRPGYEIQVVVMDGSALGTIEVVTAGEFYDFEHKYEKENTYHVPPRNISDPMIASLERAAELAYRALDCAGVARVDFLVDAEGTATILELNTLPGMTDVSLVPKVAAHVGIPYDELCVRILESAKLHQPNATERWRSDRK